MLFTIHAPLLSRYGTIKFISKKVCKRHSNVQENLDLAPMFKYEILEFQHCAADITITDIIQ